MVRKGAMAVCGLYGTLRRNAGEWTGTKDVFNRHK